MKIIFGLGSNLGDKQPYLDKALKMLQEKLLLKNLKRSKILKNSALLLPNSPESWNQEFFNIAVSAEIDIVNFPPIKILKIVKDIEKELGRVDRGKWSPREIDIDILTIENLVVDEENLKIPHYDLLNRDFFLKTIKEIEPDWQYPKL
ncbi:MAG: 2-amino-4-hydroxy-6-hydroxymethyldihydropteridine diphosphokinase [Pelagibacterales bacterium]|nr:2-amino-4-hydroxy-6-hydroxymethyldihydropteridine diphosphokinase [Pelagibacterales bacterium]